MKNGAYKRFVEKMRKRRSAIRVMAATYGRKKAAQHFRISEARVSQIVNGK